MRDYLSMKPKRQLRHEAAANSKLEARHARELVRLFGQRVMTQTIDEYMAATPADQRETIRDQMFEVLSRQVDEVMSAVDGAVHSSGPDPTDYLAFHQVAKGDKLDHGVMGMKWGRRRSDAAIAADQAVRAASGEKVTPTAKRDDAHDPDGPETPQQRYARLAGVAKGGGSSSLNDDDLAFFNKRTEAIKKVDKMFEEKPSWLRQTSNDVVKAVAKQQIQAVLSTVATKYISNNINEAITKSQAAARDAAIKEGIKKGLDEAVKKAEIKKTSKKIPIGFTAPVKK